MSQSTGFLSTGQVAQLLGCQTWMIIRLIERGALARPPKLGRHYMFIRADLPAIREALKTLGWPKPVPK